MARVAGTLAASLLLAFGAGACGGHGANALACGAVRPVTASRIPGFGDGIALGPLQLQVGSFRSGYPTKVLIGAARRLHGLLTIRGRRCSDGRRLRFSYGQPQLDIRSPPFAVAVLEGAGQATVLLKPYPGARDFFNGYFLFPTAGKYRVTLHAGGSVLDSAVISTAEGR